MNGAVYINDHIVIASEVNVALQKVVGDSLFNLEYRILWVESDAELLKCHDVVFTTSRECKSTTIFKYISVDNWFRLCQQVIQFFMLLQNLLVINFE